MTRRSHPRLTPERRSEPQPQWKGKPIIAPLVAAALAIVLMFSSSGATREGVDSGQSASGAVRGVAFDCWFDMTRDGIRLLDRFCANHTTERR